MRRAGAARARPGLRCRRGRDRRGRLCRPPAHSRRPRRRPSPRRAHRAPDRARARPSPPRRRTGARRVGRGSARRRPCSSSPGPRRRRWRCRAAGPGRCECSAVRRRPLPRLDRSPRACARPYSAAAFAANGTERRAALCAYGLWPIAYRPPTTPRGSLPQVMERR